MSSFNSTILITGGTAGIGYEAAKDIAKARPHTQIIIASRTNANDAATRINTSNHLTNVAFLPLDLSSLAQVRTFATTLTTSYPTPITALLLNAGVQFQIASYTQDNLEAHFGTNHVAHALLLFLLAPSLSPSARIIFTSSGIHDPRLTFPVLPYPGAEHLAHPTTDKDRVGIVRYTTSKLANVLYTYALARRFAEQGRTWTVNAFDPGLVPGTGLARDGTAWFRFVWEWVMPWLLPYTRWKLGTSNVHTPAESGANMARLVVGEEVQGVSGRYLQERREVESSEASYKVEDQDELWTWTVGFLGRDEEERKRFERFE